MKAYELVSGQRGRLPHCRGRDLGDIAARVGDQGVVPASKAPCAQETLRVALASDRPCQVPKATVYQWGAAGEGPPECGLLSGCAFRSDIMAWLRHAEIDLKNGG